MDRLLGVIGFQEEELGNDRRRHGFVYFAVETYYAFLGRSISVRSSLGWNGVLSSLELVPLEVGRRYRLCDVVNIAGFPFLSFFLR